MVIYKDKERKTYFFTIRVRQNDGSFKQIKRRGFKTKKEAKEAEAKAILETEKTSVMSFREAAYSYFEWYSKRRKKSSIHVIRILFTIISIMNLDKITPKHVMNYQNKIISLYSPDFLKKIHTVLSAVFNFSIKFHNSTINPARIAGNFEIDSNKRIYFWEYHEFKTFIEVVEEELYHAFFSTLYYSGARKGELLALTWGDVDFEGKIINIVCNGFIRKHKKKCCENSTN
jgi:integrase